MTATGWNVCAILLCGPAKPKGILGLWVGVYIEWVGFSLTKFEPKSINSGLIIRFVINTNI